MSEYELVPLSALVEINPKVGLEARVAHPFVAMESVSPGRRYVSASRTRTLAGGARFSPGDTLLARITPCLENGKVAQFDPDATSPGFGSTEFIVLRARVDRSDPGYTFYLAASQWVRGPAIGSMSGASGRQRADARAIAEALVPGPTLDTQRRIASILGAYDDLIEVNRRRVEVLEAMARGLFEEWFVRFRFPGHEGHKFIEAADGALPEGWRWGTAGEVIDFDPRTKIARDGEKPFVAMGCLDTSTSVISDVSMRSGSSGSKFKNGDTLFARITPCLENGKTGIVRDLASADGVGFGSTEFIVMRPAQAGRAFTYCLARLNEFRRAAEAGMSGASGRQRTQTSKVAAFPMALPPLDGHLLEAFERVAWPMLELVGEAAKCNALLSRTRDLLLPRLLSGKVAVGDAERAVEAAA